MLLAWLWLAAALGVPLRVSGRALSLLLLLGALPLAAVPIFHGLWPVDSAESRIAFTRLMQYGNGLAAVPIGLLLVEGLVRHGRKIGAGLLPAYRALVASLLLFGAGGLLGAAIGGVNTVIPAHYHGSIVGVTLGLMGLTYLLLPRLGFGLPSGRMARIQPTVYAIGQLLHIGGLAVSGAMGIQRKTAGSAQGLEGVYAKAAMGVMGLGGLLAVIGGILFVVVAWRCFLNRR
jgi:heme/copper-type cytochrome/quinol oxidase subunit 1